MGLFRFKHRTITYSTAATAASFTPSKTAGSSEVSSMAFILIWGAEAQVVRKGGAYTLGDKLEIHVACGSDLVTGDEVWEREKLESHMLV